MKAYGPEERVLGCVLEQKAKTIGEKNFFLHEDLKITYRQMDETVNRISNSFLGLGIGKGEKMSPEELISFCEDRMAYFAMPRYVEFSESLPKTPTARVEKYKLREKGVTKDTWDREKAGYKLKR